MTAYTKVARPSTSFTKVARVKTLATLLTGLVSYYRMEGNSNDSIGSNNGSDTAMTYGALYGKIGQGALLNGTTSNIALIYQNYGTSITYSLWFNTTTPSATMMLMSVMSTHWYIGGGDILFNTNNQIGGNPDISVPYTFSASTWYHLAVTVTGTSVTFYVNGISLGTQTATYGIGTGTSNHGYLIGVFANPTVYFFSGNMDEVGIWSRALTQEEITHLASGLELSTILTLPSNSIPRI